MATKSSAKRPRRIPRGKGKGRLYRLLMVTSLTGPLLCVGMLAARGSVPLPLLAASVGAVVATYRTWRWGFRLVRRLLQYADTCGSTVILRRPPELTATAAIAEYIQLAEETLRELEARFGTRLKALPTLILIPTHAEMREIWGLNLLGAALGSDSVLLCMEDAEQDPARRELMRHELAHLFGAEWRSRNAIRFIQEGLAVYLERPDGQRTLDFEALRDQLAAAVPPPYELFDNESFRSETSKNYATAGSFVGYLIREWGWDRFRDCYRRSGPENWKAVFQEVYGCDPRAASEAWLAQLGARSDEFEPELSPAVQVAKIDAAYERGDYPRCVELAEQLAAVPVPAYTCWQMGEALCRQGQYVRAVEFQQSALHNEEDRLDEAYRSLAWLRLGQLLDVTGRRSEALAAYDVVLGDTGAEARDARAWARRFRAAPSSVTDLYAVVGDSSPGG